MLFVAEALLNGLAGDDGRDWPEWLQWTVALTMLAVVAAGIVWLWTALG